MKFIKEGLTHIKNKAKILMCNIKSDEEFYKMEEILEENGFRFEFGYSERKDFIFVRLITKKVSYGTSGFDSDLYKSVDEINKFISENYKHLDDEGEIFFISDYHELENFFKPLTIDNYFNKLKSYESFINESLLDKISGPTEEEVKSTIDNLPSPTQRLIKSIDAEYIDGIKNALNNGAEIKNINVDYVAKLIQLLNLNNDEIKDLLKDESKVSIFKIAVTLNNLELVKEYGIYGSGVIHLGQDFPIRHAINNNYYDIVEYLFSMDDFKPSVLNTMVEITSDKKMIKLIMLHLRNSQLHSLMHMCKTKQLNMISIILRIYSFTKEGIEKCIEETDDEDVLFLLKNKLNTL